MKSVSLGQRIIVILKEACLSYGALKGFYNMKYLCEDGDGCDFGAVEQMMVLFLLRVRMFLAVDRDIWDSESVLVV